MRTRLVAAFVMVALVSALAASWFHTLIQSYNLPDWLHDVVAGPPWLQNLVHTLPGQPAPHLVRHTALAFLAAEAGLLLALIAAVAVAASRPVVLPVRRLAHAARRMSRGDLSVRIEPRGRDEVAQLVVSFNRMAAALEGKVSELERMEARARQFAGDVSHELRTPLTAMTAVAGILHEDPGLTGDGNGQLAARRRRRSVADGAGARPRRRAAPGRDPAPVRPVSTRPTPPAPVPRAAASAWPSPGKTPACTAAGSTRPTTPTAAPCSPSACRPRRRFQVAKRSWAWSRPGCDGLRPLEVRFLQAGLHGAAAFP